MPPDPPSSGKARRISRRQFARDAALAGATAALLPSSVLAQPQQPPPAPAQLPPSAAADFAKLPPAGQAEVEAKYQAVLRRYSGSFSAEQKTEVRRQLIGAQKALALFPWRTPTRRPPSFVPIAARLAPRKNHLREQGNAEPW
jgi:hypothetical protein